MKTRRSWIVLLSLAAAAWCAAPPATATPGYRIVGTTHLDGDDWWDYLTSDDDTGRLFVSHGTRVQVIDSSAGKVAGVIPDTPGVHGIALAHDLGKGYTSNGREDTVTVFDLKSLKVLGKISVSGKNPDAILYDPFSHHLFTFNGRSGDASVIDTAGDKEIATIPLDGKPEAGVSDGKGRIFVNNEDKSLVTVIDASSLKVLHQWPLAPGESPSGLAFDAASHRLFSVCHNKLMIVLDSEDGRVVAKLPIGEHVDGAAFDPALRRAYSSNGDGTLTVVQEGDGDDFKVLETVATKQSARTLALDAKTHHLFLSCAEIEPAPPTKAEPHMRPTYKPGSFAVLEVAPGE
ncbi:MAG TPA: YncE family protein [Candidatus Saccharimonadales bacterium]|nr:YncE family protein [Candidatus Saccharimonadales bacterium]